MTIELTEEVKKSVIKYVEYNHRAFVLDLYNLWDREPIICDTYGELYAVHEPVMASNSGYDFVTVAFDRLGNKYHVWWSADYVNDDFSDYANWGFPMTDEWDDYWDDIYTKELK